MRYLRYNIKNPPEKLNKLFPKELINIYIEKELIPTHIEKDRLFQKNHSIVKAFEVNRYKNEL
jgi:hypothetical protein